MGALMINKATTKEIILSFATFLSTGRTKRATTRAPNTREMVQAISIPVRGSRDCKRSVLLREPNKYPHIGIPSKSHNIVEIASTATPVAALATGIFNVYMK